MIIKKSHLISAIFLSLACFLVFSSPCFSLDKFVIKDSSSAKRLVITDEGKIGIGTTSPSEKIDLGGGALTFNGVDLSGGSVPKVGWDERGKVSFGFGAVGGGNLVTYSKGYSNSVRAGEFSFVYGGGNLGQIQFIHYDGSTWVPRMRITKEGYLGLGLLYASPTHLIELKGGAYSDGSTWVDASSKELKENINELSSEDAVATLTNLQPVQYNYKASKEEAHVGFIAEDVPELVATNGRKGLSPMDITAVLTKVVQEQQKTIAELKGKMTHLEGLLVITKDSDLELTGL